jgi:hypothetical protein
MFYNYVVQDLLTFTEADIKDLGVKNSAHRARVVSSLVALRTKQGKGRLRGSTSLIFPLLRQILERMRAIILFISDPVTMAVGSKRTPGEQRRRI